jgi:hypothetical protein
MLRHAQTRQESGKPTFAAMSTNGSNAQFLTFAKSGFPCFLKVRERP